MKPNLDLAPEIKFHLWACKRWGRKASRMVDSMNSYFCAVESVKELRAAQRLMEQMMEES
jgi:hypothetical protein